MILSLGIRFASFQFFGLSSSAAQFSETGPYSIWLAAHNQPPREAVHAHCCKIRHQYRLHVW